MGLIFLESLPGPKVFRCRCCGVHLAAHDAIISKDFHGRYGRAYLFKRVVNVCLGPNEERHLLTGLHTVNDIYCSCCQQILGWRYFIYDGALRNLKKVGKTQHGCLALIQCLDHAAGPTKENLVERIIATSACLSQDPYGNYVVQHIIKLQDEDYTDRLCRKLKDYCLQLCTQKHGSHVVEKCIASTGRWHLLEELVLCRKPEQIARDPYGNFVLQRALDILQGYPAPYKRLAKALTTHAQSLKSHPSAKHVISKLEKQQPSTCMR